MDFWHLIDEAIVNLRARKCRPDVDNILTILNRKKCAITKDGLENVLQELEDQNKLYRYRFKGRISYRQMSQRTRRHNGKIDEQGSCDNVGSYSSDTEEDTAVVVKTELCDTSDTNETAIQHPTADSMAVDGRKVPTPTKRAGSNPPQGRCGRSRERPVKAMRASKETDDKRKSLKRIGESKTLGGARVSGRKRIKKSHGPDFQTEVLHLDCKLQLSTCAICRNKDHDRHLLLCSACKVYVHASCLQLTERSVLKISANKQFFCLRCKPCKYCHIALEAIEGCRGQEASSLTTVIEGNDVLHCSHCYSVFHLGCIRPALTGKPKGKPWMCRRCTYEINKRHRTKDNLAALVTSTEVSEPPSLAAKSDRNPVKTEKVEERIGSKPSRQASCTETCAQATCGDPKDDSLLIGPAKSAEDVRSTGVNRQSCDSSSSVVPGRPNPSTARTPARVGKLSSKKRAASPDSNNPTISGLPPLDKTYADGDSGNGHERSEDDTPERRSIGLKKVFLNDDDSELRKKLLEILPSSRVNKKNASVDNNNNNAEGGVAHMGEHWQRLVAESQGSVRITEVEVSQLDLRRSKLNRQSSTKQTTVLEDMSACMSTFTPAVSSSIENNVTDATASLVGNTVTGYPPPQAVIRSVGSSPSPTGSDIDNNRNTGTLAQFAIHYPDVSQWSATGVARFFAEIGYTNEARVFIEQEIDGASLLLLKRTDVLGILGLKLGPALKMFRHISGLQKAASTS